MILYIRPGLIATPDEIIKSKGIYVDTNAGKIKSIDIYRGDTDLELFLPEDTIAFPGLLNAHDHLLGTYWPRVGEGPHLTWKQWDDLLKSSPIYKERSNISNSELYMLGGYKNLLSGCTFVMDHFPHHFNEKFIDKLYVRVLKEYTLAHEVSSYDLKWGDGVEVEHKRAVERNWPFVTHIEEGFDEESMKGIDYLVEMNALTEHTVMIHGLALSDYDLDRIAKSRAHLVTCPMSNFFMFRKIARLKEWFSRNINVSLGTDSPMSGSMNMLEEMKYLKMIYRSTYGEDIDAKTITFMVTKNPAKAFRVDKKLGYISEGYLADITIIKDKKLETPYDSLVEAHFNDIELVLIGGKPYYGYSRYEGIFKKLLGENNYSKCIISGQERLVIGNLPGLIQTIRKKLGFNKELPFIPITL